MHMMRPSQVHHVHRSGAAFRPGNVFCMGRATQSAHLSSLSVLSTQGHRVWLDECY